MMRQRFGTTLSIFISLCYTNL